MVISNSHVFFFFMKGEGFLIYITFLVLLALAIVLYMVKEALENNVLTHEVELNGELDDVTLFFISDIHVRRVSEKMIQSISKKVDAVIIGGDLADKRTPIDRIYSNITLLKSLGPVYFVWGNNDREVGETQLRQLFEETGVHIIEDDAILLHQNKKIWLSAVDFSIKNSARLQKTFEKVQNNGVNFFISHNPQVFPSVLKQYKEQVHFLMGGHLHGGQIRFGSFGIHPHGSFSTIEGVPTLISNGYGTTLLPLRLGARPQCHIIDVKFKR